MSWLSSFIAGPAKPKEDEKTPATNSNGGSVNIVDIADPTKKKHRKKQKKKAKSDADFNNFVWLGGKEVSPPSSSRPARSSIYPSINGNNIYSPPTTLPTQPDMRKPPAPSPYDLLKRSSCRLNPKVQVPTTAAVTLPPGLFNLIIEQRERLIYDGNFEREVIAKCEARREQREKEAELQMKQHKSIQESLLKEWLEQQTRKQQQQQQPPQLTPATTTDDKMSDDTSSKMSDESLVDLRFPSPHNSPLVRHTKLPRIESTFPTPTTTPSEEEDLPPPYPGLPVHMTQQPQPPPPIHFPAPPPYQSPLTTATPPATTTIHFPTPSSGFGMGGGAPPPYGTPSGPPLTMPHGWTNMASSVGPYPVAPGSMSTSYPYFPGPAVAFPSPPLSTPLQQPQHPQHPQHVQPKRAQSDMGMQHPPPYRSSLGASAPTPVYEYKSTGFARSNTSPLSRNAPSGNGFTHTTVTGPKVEDYVKKYPILATNGKQVFMSLVSGMQLDPDIVATALEIYPDTEEAKLVNFATSCKKYVQMGFPMHVVKQALLLYENEPSATKCTAYLSQFDQLLKTGFKEADIFDAFSLFENDVKKASDFLLAYRALQQFGFGDVQIREALLLHENDKDKAAQYLSNM